MKKITIPTKQERRIELLEIENEVLKEENKKLKTQMKDQENAIVELSMIVGSLM